MKSGNLEEVGMIRSTCSKCKYSAWCLPQAFGGHDIDHWRPLVCESCGRLAGKAELVRESFSGSIIIHAAVEVVVSAKTRTMARPCELKGKNVVYATACTSCAPTGEDVEVYLSITTDHGTFNTPAGKLVGNR